MSKLQDSLYHGHRFPAEVISHVVWLYFRFPLSLRMVEGLLAACGIIVSHERFGARLRSLVGTSPTPFRVGRLLNTPQVAEIIEMGLGSGSLLKRRHLPLGYELIWRHPLQVTFLGNSYLSKIAASFVIHNSAAKACSSAAVATRPCCVRVARYASTG
jgi:hypothetical protein